MIWRTTISRCNKRSRLWKQRSPARTNTEAFKTKSTHWRLITSILNLLPRSQRLLISSEKMLRPITLLALVKKGLCHKLKWITMISSKFSLKVHKLPVRLAKQINQKSKFQILLQSNLRLKKVKNKIISPCKVLRI